MRKSRQEIEKDLKKGYREGIHETIYEALEVDPAKIPDGGSVVVNDLYIEFDEGATTRLKFEEDINIPKTSNISLEITEKIKQKVDAKLKPYDAPILQLSAYVIYLDKEGVEVSFQNPRYDFT